MGNVPDRLDPRVGYDLMLRAEALLADAARLIAEGRALLAEARRIWDQSRESNGEAADESRGP
jgi:hypothetical protein